MIDFKIVIVENVKDLRDSMHETLIKDFYVTSVTTGVDCLKHLEKNDVDLVLIDFELSNMNSVELQHEISKYYPSVYVALISNIEHKKVALETMRRRAMDYIYKSKDQEIFALEVYKLVRYILDTKKMDRGFIKSGFYDLAYDLYSTGKFTVEEVERIINEYKKNRG